MSGEVEFLQAVRTSPRDEALRLVYADWLEERGDPRAEFLRLDLQLARRRRGKGPAYERRLSRWHELRATLDPIWVARVARASWGVSQHSGRILTLPDPTPGGWGWSYIVAGTCGFSPYDLEIALRALDGFRNPCLFLRLDTEEYTAWWSWWPCVPVLSAIPDLAGPPAQYPGCDCFFLLGHRDTLMLIACFREGCFRYRDPEGGRSPITIWDFGPGHVAPECEVCLDFELAFEATRFFYYHGRLHPELPWQAEPPPWERGGFSRPGVEAT